MEAGSMKKEKQKKLFLVFGLFFIACSAWRTVHVRAEGTGQELNYMPVDSYEAFGLPVGQNAPEDFQNGAEDPLADFEAGSYSRLYLGVMNKNSKMHGQGSFKVMETAQNLDGQKKNITLSNPDKGEDGNLDKNLRGQETSYQDYHDKSMAYQTQNVVAVDRGRAPDGTPLPAAFVENVLYRGNVTVKDKTKCANRQRIRLYVPDADGNYQDKGTVDRALANKDSLSVDGFKDIKAEGKNGLISMTSGDYDGDGVAEVAIYVPDTGCLSDNYTSQAGIEIFKINGDTLTSWLTINLRDISGAFNFAYKSWYVPVVSLSTTGISGQDDLVVTASLPLRKSDGYANQDQNSVLAIYRLDGGSPKRQYYDNMNYGDYRMRYASAVDADINGNMTKELVVGGYKNEDYSSKDKVGKLSGTTQLIQVITWDEDKNVYLPVWDSPKSVDTLTAADKKQKLDFGYEMTEPAALAAGQYDLQSNVTDIFLEGVIFQYKSKSTVPGNKKEKENLKGGTFERVSNITLCGTQDAWVGTALTGRFLSDSYGSQQTVIITGDHNSDDLKQGINLDISWLYKNGADYTHYMANNDYFYHSDNGSYGTFLTLCEMPATENTQYYKYQGKDYGWSAPEVMAVLPSIPYWEELSPNPQEAGGTSFRVESGLTRESEGNLHVGLDFEFGGSLQFGGKAFQEKAMKGVSFNVGFGGEYIYRHMAGVQKTVSHTWTPKAGQDSVLVFAKPIVVYNYKMWLPTHEVTEDEVKKAQELNAMLPDDKKEVYPYNAGDIMEGHFEDVQVSCGYSSVTSVISCDTYNTLAEQYNLKKIDMDKLLPHTAGDPSTYPASFDVIPGFPKAEGAKKNVLTSDVITVSDAAGAEIDFSKSHGSTNPNGFQLNVHGGLGSKMSVSLGFIAGKELELESGGTIHANGGGMFSAAASGGNGITASFAALKSPDPSLDYTYNAQMAVWNSRLDGVQAAEGEKEQGPYILGCAVTKLPQQVPPRLPARPYVYAEFTRESILGWDVPSGDRSSPTHYNLYRKKDDGSYEPVKNGSGIDPAKKYFILYGLEPGTTYTFAFEAETDAGTRSLMGQELNVTTREENTLKFEEPPKNQKTDSQRQTASFTATLNVEDTARETICQWQTHNGDGQWEDIEGATNTLTDTQADTSYTAYDAKDRSFYRVKATRYYKDKLLPSVSFSKGASVLYDSNTPDISFDIADEAEDLISNYTFIDNTDGMDALYSGTAVIAEPNAGSPPTQFTLPVEISTLISSLSNNYRWTLNLSKKEDGSDLYEFRLPKREADVSVPYHDAQREYPVRAETFLGPERVSESDTQMIKVLVPGQDMYAISYDLNHGDNAPENPEQIGQEAQGLTLNAPVKKGSSFQGFRFKGTDTLLAFQNPDQDPAQTVTVVSMQELHDADAADGDADGRVTFEAVWEDGTFPVTYEGLEGTANPNPDHYTLNSDTVLKEPARDGYRFTGWYTDPGHTNRVRILPSDLPPQNQGQDITVYAGWEAEDYEINYLMDGGLNDPDNPQAYSAADAGNVIKPAKDRMYSFNGKEYLAGKFTGWHENGTDPAGAAFDYALPSGGFRALTLRAHYDYGQLFYDPNLRPEDRTVEDSDSLASMGGLIHPDAYLSALTYDRTSWALDPIFDGLDAGDEFIGGYHIRLLNPANQQDINQVEPADAVYEGPLTLSFYLAGADAYETGSLRLIQVTGDGRVMAMPLSEAGGRQRASNLYSAEIESLNTPVFAVIGTPKQEPGKPEEPDEPKDDGKPESPDGPKDTGNQSGRNDQNANTDTNGNTRRDAPVSGDTNHLWMFVLIMAGSAVVIILVVVIRIRGRHSRK